MAGVLLGFCTPQITTGTAAKTIVQFLAATNHRALLRRCCIAFEGVSTTGTPILVEFVIQTSAGTGGTSLTLRKLNSGDAETIQTTALYGPTGATWTAEPSDSSDVRFHTFVHPQRSKELILPGDFFSIVTAVRFGVRVTADAAVDCVVSGVVEE